MHWTLCPSFRLQAGLSQLTKGKTMSRKDFELIAAIFARQIAKHEKGTPEYNTLSDAIGMMTASMQANYPSFQPARFTAACLGLAK
jgi:hypothetical protein